MRLKAIGGAALAFAAACCMAPAGAAPASCERTGAACTDSGIGTGDDFSHLTLYASKDRTRVPKPATLLICGLGLLSLGLARRNKT